MPIKVNFEGILDIVSCNLQHQMQKMKLPTVCYRFLAWQPILAVGGIFVGLFSPITGSSATTAPDLDRADKISLARRSSPQLVKLAPQLIAGVDNFNPDLKLLPPQEKIPIPPPPSPPTQTAPSAETNAVEVAKPNPVGTPFAVLEGLQPNIHIDRNNSGQVNQTIESTAILRLNNGDRLLFTTGNNTYEQPGVKTVTNIPLRIDWETKINALKVQPGVGVDLLSGSTTPNFNLKVDYPVTAGLTVSADLQQGAYKFNAKTIGNQISALRYGPSIFWQIDKETSLFSSLHFGNYSDNNQEQQSFSRIERKLGEFSVAGNLFTWNYQNPTDKGYFAPPDFLVYTGEVAWEGSVIRDLLSCRLSASLGGQHVNAQNSDAGGYQTKCTAKISPNLEADLGYSFSNVKSHDTGGSPANSQSILSQIRWKF